MRILGCIALVLSLAGPASATDQRALIEQALDEPAKITLNNVKLGDAIDEITRQTGVPIVMPDAAMQLVPRGEDALVREVNIDGLPLRRALHDLFAPLGMTFAVRDNNVEIIPQEPIRQLGRAPTWAELDTLALLSAMEPGLDAAALGSLEPRMQIHVPVRDGWKILSSAIRDVGAGSGDEVLSIACRNLGWSWTLSGERIAVSPMQEEIRRRLRQPISLRMNNQPLFDVLQAVGRKIDIRIDVEPGVLAGLPLAMRHNFSINAQRQSVDSVLDSIAAYTDLGYLIEPDGVLFFDPAGMSAQQPPQGMPTGMADPGGLVNPADDPYVAKIAVPLGDGRTIEWLIRRSELPEDLRAMRAKNLTEFFEAARRQSEPRP